MPSQITCITKPDRENTHEAIQYVGGIRGSGSQFYISRRECADDIDSGRDSYFVHVGLYKTNVTTYQRNGEKFIRTNADATTTDNLLSLKSCT